MSEFHKLLVTKNIRHRCHYQQEDYKAIEFKSNSVRLQTIQMVCHCTYKLSNVREIGASITKDKRATERGNEFKKLSPIKEFSFRGNLESGLNFGWEEDKGERLTLKKARYGTQLELIGNRERERETQTDKQKDKPRKVEGRVKADRQR